MATLLIVEDDSKTNEAICEYMKSAGHEAIPVYDGAEAVRHFQEKKPDLVVLDIMLPKMTGLAVLHEIRRSSSAPVLMLTAIEDEYTQIQSFDEQADDYITKPFNPLELLARVKSMMRRYTSLGSIAEKNNVIRIGDVELDKDAKEVRVNGKLVKMTATEYGILQLLMENAGKVFSIDEIYERVWNESSFSPENTVSVHIRRIREKIEINPKEPRYLKVERGMGYKIEKI